jgi:shikimate dehydrogenase
MTFTFKEFKKSNKSGHPHYLVVGNPIGHSLSPVMHQAALDYHGINAQYHAINLAQADIADFIGWLNRDEFLGCNITIPYKSQFVEVVDQIDRYAREAGVINTIAKSDHQLIGHNTDIHGFTSPLLKYTDQIEGGRVIVFGTGGAAKAVMIGLEDLGVEEIVFVSRTPHQSNMKSDHVWVDVVSYDQWQSYADEASMIVNTTPLGMSPDTDRSPISDFDGKLLENKICYDLIYNPLQTKFLKQADEFGAVTINGLDMLIMQGNRSFEIWTGKTFPFESIKELLSNKLK